MGADERDPILNRPVFRIAQESSEQLKATRKALLLKDVQDGTEDARVLHEINAILTRRALGMEREDGWPTALDDPEDDGLDF